MIRMIMTGSRRVSRAQVCFLSTSFFVTNFVFVLGTNCTTMGMPDNGGTWYWQGREGRCDECSLVMEHLVLGFFVNIYTCTIPVLHRYQLNIFSYFNFGLNKVFQVSTHIFWHF